MMVFANSPESGRILSMGMSRFSGYSSGASTTGQRSWGKSETNGKPLEDWKCVCFFLLFCTPETTKCSPPIPRQSVLRKASICSCPTPLAPFWPNSRWESSRCKTSMAISWKPPSWFPPRSASTYDRRRSGSFCFTNCAAEEEKTHKQVS